MHTIEALRLETHALKLRGAILQACIAACIASTVIFIRALQSLASMQFYELPFSTSCPLFVHARHRARRKIALCDRSIGYTGRKSHSEQRWIKSRLD